MAMAVMVVAKAVAARTSDISLMSVMAAAAQGKDQGVSDEAPL